MVLSRSPIRAFLSIENITHRYGQKAALENVSLEAQKSDIVALLGPSGSGKSTLLAAIAGIISPGAGRIMVGGQNLLDLPPEARGLGMVFQDYALWPHMTVAQNVAFQLRSRRYPPQEINARVEEALSASVFTDSTGAAPTSYPAGSSSESRWPALSSPRHNCSCSTSRFRLWIPPPEPASAANLPTF